MKGFKSLIPSCIKYKNIKSTKDRLKITKYHGFLQLIKILLVNEKTHLPNNINRSIKGNAYLHNPTEVAVSSELQTLFLCPGLDVTKLLPEDCPPIVAAQPGVFVGHQLVE